MQTQNGNDATAGSAPARLRNLFALTRQRYKASQPRAPQPVTQSLIDGTLNAMPTHVAILDGDGRILLLNRAWRYFAASLAHPLRGDLIGVEYLKSGILGALDRRDALMLRLTLKAMLHGDIEHVQRVIHTGEPDRWYQVTASRFENGSATRIVVTHEDISAVHAAQDTIKDLSQRLLDLQEEERQRIALDLHDSTAQQLTAISLSLACLRRHLGDNTGSQRLFEDIENLVQEAHKEIRTFSYLLHPPYLERDGMRQTLTRFIEGYGRRTGLSVVTEVAAEIDTFGADVQRALLRIVQEALANVHRHASATAVTVKMSVTKRKLVFSISDNGKGMEPVRGLDSAHASTLGLGLPGMHARVKQLDGVLQIVSGTSGTTVSGRIPSGKPNGS